MNCPSCGRTHDGAAERCDDCLANGTPRRRRRVPRAQRTTQAEQVSNSTAQVTRTKKSVQVTQPPRPSRTTAGIIMLLGLLIGVGACVYIESEAAAITHQIYAVAIGTAIFIFAYVLARAIETLADGARTRYGYGHREREEREDGSTK